MNVVRALGAVFALIASILLLRIVLHGYTAHGYLDVFHLVVGIAAAVAGLLLARHALLRRA